MAWRQTIKVIWCALAHWRCREVIDTAPWVEYTRCKKCGIVRLEDLPT